MTRFVPVLFLCAVVAACGVDGEPETPQPQPAAAEETQPQPQPQPQRAAPPPYVTGGLTITNNGVYPSIGISQGWWSIRLGGIGGWWY